MELLYGKPVADKILGRIKSAISLSAKKPGLAVILVGDDKASQIYVALKEKKAREIGMNFFRFDLPSFIPENEIIERIGKLNKDVMVHGIIVQLPLPSGFDTSKIIGSIDPQKDADGFHPENTAKFLQSKGDIWPVFPRAITCLLESSGEDLKSKKALIVANSDDFGKIMRSALEQKNLTAEYILAGDLPSNLGKIKAADVLVSAVGSPGLLKGQMLQSGSIVIDGGIEKVGERVLGDVDFASTKDLLGFITPVPGGVGPLTIACLLENVYLAFKAQQKEE